MSGWLGWAIVIGGPVVCALAGGWYEHLRILRQVDTWCDAAYAQGWDEARARAQMFYGSMQRDAEYARQTTARLLMAAPTPAAERLAALPALHHEGPRHAAPQEAAQSGAYDPLIGGVRAEFDRIRVSLNLASYYSQAEVISP